jgi:hypothetical protein
LFDGSAGQEVYREARGAHIAFAALELPGDNSGVANSEQEYVCLYLA